MRARHHAGHSAHVDSDSEDESKNRREWAVALAMAALASTGFFAVLACLALFLGPWVVVHGLVRCLLVAVVGFALYLIGVACARPVPIAAEGARNVAHSPPMAALVIQPLA